ncbi:uncharacterized protein F5891DRAFT_1193479 [Suillus fuscotomentosus]|uniref:Uncharacterized protein n=1 Tax=Suillus fuscotomentosus TaxID=1912939 RepID=A0AAD4DYL2_9AGAM|nr:uncharacterized protein F5891DRAFT_1193479 [Suillus fuscotomentosus]KAG1896042.1 hypothetical protein F5891DRAFT_1193479 [Suillus fuscotomentosus]
MSLSTQRRLFTSLDGIDDIRAREVLHRTETCNIVIFGETGAGLTDFIAGLYEGSKGTVPNEEAQKVLKKLLRNLAEQDGIHLLIYCVQGTRESTAYPPAKRSKGGVGFEPCLLIFYVDKNESVNMQRTEVQKVRKVYAKSKVGLVVVVCGCDSDEDAKGWWEGSNDTGKDSLLAPSITFTCLPRDGSERSESAQETLQKLIWELSRTGEPCTSVVRDLLNRVLGYLIRVV